LATREISDAARGLERHAPRVQSFPLPRAGGYDDAVNAAVAMNLSTWGESLRGGATSAMVLLGVVVLGPLLTRLVTRGGGPDAAALRDSGQPVRFAPAPGFYPIITLIGLFGAFMFVLPRLMHRPDLRLALTLFGGFFVTMSAASLWELRSNFVEITADELRFYRWGRTKRVALAAVESVYVVQNHIVMKLIEGGRATVPLMFADTDRMIHLIEARARRARNSS
jgi:hypothetical protein